MGYDDEVYEKILSNYELLCNIIRQSASGPKLKVDLSKIGEIINKKILTEWKKIFANGMINRGLISKIYKQFSQVSQFSCSVVSDSLRPHDSEHARPPCPSPTPRVHPYSCASSR